MEESCTLLTDDPKTSVKSDCLLWQNEVSNDFELEIKEWNEKKKREYKRDTERGILLVNGAGACIKLQ